LGFWWNPEIMNENQLLLQLAGTLKLDGTLPRSGFLEVCQAKLF